ncbi:MAG: branched-chain amino acid ABC transporter permease [Desulfobacteraceae bacterium]|nr:MAG: branched-chain amino acid ABC transporter permease [Desulfobacteraceae bacterium]
MGVSKQKIIISLLVLAGIFAAVPFGLPRFYVYLIALIITTGLLSTSLNFVLGFGGIYQFHHGVFYGVGAYGAAVTIMKLGWNPWIGFIVGPLVSAFLSVVLGVICIRLSKLYFGMLQISLGSLLWVIVYRWYSFTGGDDGIHGITVPRIIETPTGAYYFTVLVGAVSMFTMYRILHAPFGSILQGIRDNVIRSQAVGVNVRRHQLIALVIAGFFAGVAGVLFVAVDNSVFPDMLFWTLSLEITIMALLGGWFTFLGPMLGAAIIVLLRTFVSTVTDYWQLVLSVLLVLVILFLPEGILGKVFQIWNEKKRDKEIHGEKARGMDYAGGKEHQQVLRRL